MTGRVELAPVVLPDPALTDAMLADLGVYDDSDARDVVGERDVPGPAVLVGLDEDVGGVGIGQTLGTGKVSVDRHVAELVVPSSEAESSAEHRGLSAGVDHPVGFYDVLRAVFLFELHAEWPSVLDTGGGDRASLSDIHA